MQTEHEKQAPSALDDPWLYRSPFAEDPVLARLSNLDAQASSEASSQEKTTEPSSVPTSGDPEHQNLDSKNISFWKALNLFFQNTNKKRHERESFSVCSVRKENHKLYNSFVRRVMATGFLFGAVAPFLSATAWAFLPFFAFSGWLILSSLHAFRSKKIVTFLGGLMFFASGFSVGQTAAVVSLTEIIKGPATDLFVRYPVFKERLFSYGFSEEDSVKKAVLANGKTPWNAFWWDQTGSLKEEYRAPFCQNFRSGIDQEIRATPVTMVSPEIDILLLSGTVKTGYINGCYTKKELVETLSSVRSAHKKPVFDLTQMKGMSLFGLFRQTESVIKPRSLGLSRQKFCEISTSKLINEKGFSSEQKSFEQANAFCAKTFENKTLFDDNVSLGRVSIEDAQKLDSVVSNSWQVFFEMNSLKPAEDILKRVPQLTEKDLVDIENLVTKNQKTFLVKDPVLPMKKEKEA